MKTLFHHLATIFFIFTLSSTQNISLAAPSPESLSGNYNLHFEQTSKSCGAKISPVDVDVAINFSDSRINMKFPSGFLGINILDAKYDSQNGTFKDQLKQRVNLGSTKANLTLDIKGKLVNQSSKPEIRFDITFNKTADDPDWNCKVKGKGLAKKL